jgi:hypothetical protein
MGFSWVAIFASKQKWRTAPAQEDAEAARCAALGRLCRDYPAVLGPEEYRTGLIREGLRRELERREKLTKRSPRGKQ